MIALEVSRHLWAARVDPRRRTHAVGSYVHVLDQWGISYDQPIIINEREAGPAIEGAIRSPSSKIEAVAVDTKGHTHFAAGFAKVLTLDLYPRLHKLKYQQLFVPKGIDVPDTLTPIIGPTVSLNAIKRDWDEFVRLAAHRFDMGGVRRPWRCVDTVARHAASLCTVPGSPWVSWC
jgi:TnpA family transposase